MGEDLSLPERDAIRTPMQWSGTENGGFSEAPTPDRLIRPVVSSSPFGFKDVNVTDQRLEPDSMLSWFERMLHTLRECDEIGSGTHRIIDGTPPSVLAHVAEGPTGVVLFVHNLSEEAHVVHPSGVPHGGPATGRGLLRPPLRRARSTRRSSRSGRTASAGSACGGPTARHPADRGGRRASPTTSGRDSTSGSR